jgi:hypothetical protein
VRPRYLLSATLVVPLYCQSDARLSVIHTPGEAGFGYGENT